MMEIHKHTESSGNTKRIFNGSQLLLTVLNGIGQTMLPILKLRKYQRGSGKCVMKYRIREHLSGDKEMLVTGMIILLHTHMTKYSLGYY